MRKLSDQFMEDLNNPEGKLHPILTRVKKDHTLMLAIRENFINIYYRGGNILNIRENNKGFYQTSFDENYNQSVLLMPDSPTQINHQDDSKNWVDSFPFRKNMMDEYFSTYGKAEREFQQLIARENNNSTISNESEYFVADIEVTESDARFDMIAIRWLASHRQSGSNCKAALIEVKYGDGALGGKAGLLKHLQDMEKLISNKERYSDLLQTMESQFNQLDELGLLKFNKGTSKTKVKLNPGEKPEVIFILANHNPRSTKLKTMLGNPDIKKYAQSQLFDLKFFVASFAGYGMHAKCMLPLNEFLELL
ncbi:MAG: hypothetical protein CL609_08950 [Anaerolineaceae bacterium]|nr:hypothetical protein [Anaerolineaceae bacterium]